MFVLGDSVNWGGFDGPDRKIGNFAVKIIIWHQSKFQILALGDQISNIRTVSAWPKINRSHRVNTSTDCHPFNHWRQLSALLWEGWFNTCQVGLWGYRQTKLIGNVVAAICVTYYWILYIQHPNWRREIWLCSVYQVQRIQAFKRLFAGKTQLICPGGHQQRNYQIL